MAPYEGRSNAPDHPALVVRPRAAAVSKNGLVATCLRVGQHPVVPFAKTLDNVVWGIKERVLYIDSAGTRPPRCMRGVGEFDEVLGRVAQLAPRTRKLSVHEFLCTRPSRTRAVYERAAKTLEGAYRLGDLSKTKLFVKWEKTRWTKPQVPRIINPRDPAYNILVGRYLVPMEKVVFSTLTQLLGQRVSCVAKGRTNRQRAEDISALMEGGYAAIGLDASRFDQSVGKTMLSLEHKVYSLFNDSRELAWLLREQLNNRGTYVGRDGSLSCRYGAIRCSGDQNTSLGNCTISVLLAHKMCLELGVEHRIYCDGDDLLLFVPPRSVGVVVGRVSEWYLEWGFRMKLEPVAWELEDVEFCQAKVVDIDGPVLVRNPRKALDTDYCCYFDNIEVGRYRELMHMIGSCGLSLTAGCPVMQSWYLFGLREGVKPTSKRVSRELWNTGLYRQAMLEAGFSKAKPVTLRARESFARAFQISVAEQFMLERHFEQLSVDFAVKPSSYSLLTNSECLYA